LDPRSCRSVSGHRLSTAEVESALILHKGVAETAVVGSHDDITGQAVYAFVTMKPEFDLEATKEDALAKELAIQVRKVIGPFAAPKKIVSANASASASASAERGPLLPRIRM
jgi:acetyl-CoA synthetase